MSNILIHRKLSIQFPDCRLFFHGEGVMTEYEDGAQSYNVVPNDDGYFSNVAESIGYKNRNLDYLFEHEYVHHLLCYEIFRGPSYVIRNAALGLPLDSVASGLEEKIVYYFQRFLHWRIPSPDIQWDDLSKKARETLWPDVYTQPKIIRSEK